MELQLLSVVRYSEQNQLWSNAIFFAERYYAEKTNNASLFSNDVASQEQALQVLASVYYKAGKVNKAYLLLLTTAKTAVSSELGTSPENRYLFALCCYELDKVKEAETALIGGNSSATASEVIASNKVPNGAAGFYLLGLICK
jgi:anaphase-promoting complex subunit 3